ncbi:DUF1844 domain-containing protein [Terriglobus albidus]|uniref:DUF1844 domain-containing protein n=1 Tax=Terriglobus albidus TaxID=1592106 RepID=UPI0021E0D5FA|nr:DUF1844 domain-containing protein [Terriglobus albidus]
MADKVTPFVVNDRRKFTTEGELRPESERPHDEEQSEASKAAVTATPEPPASESAPEPEPEATEQELPKLTEEQAERSKAAYEATAERLDTAIRAANPGMEQLPPVNFDRLVQSIYMTAIMQLGGGTPEGEQARVDILGARQSIDMLGVLQEKSKGNLTEAESRMLENALFEVRMAFLEITQALARQASRQPESPLPPPPGGGPRIVR